MSKLMLNLIIVLHFIFVLCVVLVPFIGSNYYLLMHAIIVPFVIFHWIINDNTCALTLMEKKIRFNLYGTIPNPDDCFTYKLIAPVYDFKKNNTKFSTLIYVVTITLWLISIYKLYDKYKNGKIKTMHDMFC